MGSWWLIVLIAALAMLPGLAVGPSLDASVFSTVGWRLTEGERLYATVWDHKPPGVYAVHLLAQALTDNPSAAWLVVWLLTVAAAATTAWVVRYRLASIGIGWPARAASVLTVLTLGSYLVALGGGLGESFAVLPAAGAVLVVTARREIPQRWLLAGLLVGAAALVSLQAASVAGAIAVLGWQGGSRAIVRRAVSVICGIAIAAGLFLVTLVATGTMAEAFDGLVTYTAAYRSSIRPGGSNLVPWLLILFLPLILPAVTGPLIGRNRLLAPRLSLACSAWLIVGVVGIAVQGRLYGHYALPLAVPVGILAGIGLESLRRHLPSGRSGLVMLLTPVFAVTVVALLVGAAGAEMEERWIRQSNNKVDAVAPVIAALVHDGTLFVWGNEPRLYELADRTPASRYVYLYPLLTPGYANGERIAEALAVWESTPPSVIVDAGGPAPGELGLPPLLIDRPVSTDGRDLDLLDPLRTFVRDHYELADTVAGWPVYILVTPE